MSLNDESAVAEMLSRYGFDLGGQTAANLVRTWSRQFDASWLLPAVIEALDRGRYKSASVEQVLASWQRSGNANPRFKADFAAMVLSKIDASPTLLEESDLNESLLDAEITSYTESIVEDTVAPVFDLSDPALAEDGEKSQTSHPASAMSASLIPTEYPPLPLRKPDDLWDEHYDDRNMPSLPETFTPPTQVSQFYYRLLAMADTAPVQSASAAAVLTMPPMIAEG
jgi:hypothetical protein